MFDTLLVAQAHMDTLCLSPINSGATIRKPARRGLATFTPAKDHSYAQWRRLRGKSDKVVEITVDHAIPRASEFLIDVQLWP